MDRVSLSELMIEDTDAAFRYSPAAAWLGIPVNISQFSAGTGQ